METTFQDKLLTCSECSNQFVYTVGQQRMAFDEEGVVTDPDLCAVCSVKVERMGRRAEVPRAEQTRSDDLYTRRNGYHHSTNGSNGEAHRGEYRNGNGSAGHSHEEPEDDVENYDIPTEPYSQEQPKAPSPNRPADYRSGDEHPLAGHGGERYTGHVKWFNDRKGFGFITLDNGVEIFVHYSGIISEGYKTLKQNQRVEIAVEDTGKGPQAAQVTVLQDEPPAESGDDQLSEAAD